MKLQVHIPLAEIESWVNQRFGERLHQGAFKDMTGSRSQVRVDKLSPIRLWGEGECLMSEVQIAVKVSAAPDDLSLAGLFKDLSGLDKTRFALTVRLHTQLSLGPLWQLQARSEVHYQWDQKPKLGLPLLKIGIGDWLAPLLNRELAKVAQEVDGYIQQAADLPKLMQEAWQSLQRAHELTLPWSLWFRLSPEASSLCLGPIQYDTQALSLTVALTLDPEVQIPEALAQAPAQAVPPPPARSPLVFDESELPFCARADWTWATQQLAPKTYDLDQGRYQLDLQSLKAQVADARLWVTGDFAAKVPSPLGRLSLSGKARLDTQPTVVAGKIKLQSLRFRLEEASWRTRWAYWLGRKRWQKRLAQALENLIQEQLLVLDGIVRQELAQLALSPELLLKVAWQHSIPTAISLTDRGLGLDFRVVAKAQLHIRPLLPDQPLLEP